MSRPVGSIEYIGRDKDGLQVWRVQTAVGAQGKGGRASATVHGSRRDAEIAAHELRSELLGRPSNIVTMTLDEYFYTRFIPRLERLERTRATITSYRKTYELHIQPHHGEMMLTSIDDLMIRRLVASSSSGRNTLRTYRAIMNAAYDERAIPHPINFNRIQYSRPKPSRPQPWSRTEIHAALDALRGEEIVELALCLGICGLRKEEILAITPGSIGVLRKEGGIGTDEYLYLRIDSAFTDEDGIKVTKTPDSVREVVVPPFVAPRLRDLVDQTVPSVRMVRSGACLITYPYGWKTKKEARYVDRLFEGTLSDAERDARSRGCVHYKIEAFDEGRMLVRSYAGIRQELVRDIKEEPFVGTLEQARSHAIADWRRRRLLPLSGDRLTKTWKRVLERRGLRYIPISMLRHTSESLMAESGVSAALIAKAHGHATFTTDLKHYIDLDSTRLVGAADLVTEAMGRAQEDGLFKIHDYMTAAGEDAGQP
ncbi:MAG: hypothetical protein SOU51_01050 [Collinsella sp.]|nr:hypothetical protein [Collinsella sp.]